MSRVLLRSATPGTGSKLVAAEAKATQRPLALNDGVMLAPLVCSPPGPTLTRVVVPLTRSYTKISDTLLVSSGNRLSATDWKATLSQRPSRLVKELAPLAPEPSKPLLAKAVVPVTRPRTKTSVVLLLSSGTRLVASELKLTQRQPASIDGRKPCAWLGPFGFAPLKPTLTRVVECASRSYT